MLLEKLLQLLSSLMSVLVLPLHRLLFRLSRKSRRSLVLALPLVFSRLLVPSLTLADTELSLILQYSDVFFS